MPIIKAILFDLGNTLLSFGPINTTDLFARGARLAYRYLQRLGFRLPPFRAYHRRRLWMVRWHYIKSRITQREFNSLTLLARVEKSNGRDLTEEQTQELAWQWYRPLGRCASVEEGLHGVLGGFRNQGLNLGIVSNTFVPGQVLDRHLAQLGLLEYLPVRVYSCDVRFRKPCAKIFQIALSRLQIRPAEAMFVGDNLFEDIAGARRTGMISVLKDPTGARKHSRIRPNHRVTCLKELPQIVASYNGAGAG